MAKSEFRFNTPMRVRWSECDAQGIAFYGSYLIYFEVGLSEYFRNLGFRLYGDEQQKYFDTATVKLTMEYKAPARIDDVIRVYGRTVRIGSKSFTMEFEIYRGDSEELLTWAEIVYVNYDAESGEARMYPDDLRELATHFEQAGEVLPIEKFPVLAAMG